jgi:plastocyanin
MERLGGSDVRTSVKGSLVPVRLWRGARRLRREGPGRVSVAVVALAAAALVALGADVRAGGPAAVDIQDSKYLPPTLTVPVGTTVRWTNRDEETHTVTSTTGLFGSAGLDLGEEYTHTFTAPGVYPYTCDLHSFMQGTIIVN